MIDPIVHDNFNHIFSDLAWELSQYPEHTCNPRGMGEVREVLVPTLILDNPRNRLITIPARKADYGFGVGEFLWYYRGASDLESLLYYNKRAAAYSDDGQTVNSAYGKRLLKLLNPHHNRSQWLNVVDELAKDPDSRRAVMTVFRPEDLDRAVTLGSKDVPCTLSLQFFIRSGKLSLHAHMRSNDVMWGLTYDLFSFTLLQECMLLTLKNVYPDLELGPYYHTAGSMHLYERHYKMAGEVVAQSLFKGKGEMKPIDLEGLERLVSDEERLRTRQVVRLDPASYEGGVRWMCEQLNNHREKRDGEAVR